MSGIKPLPTRTRTICAPHAGIVNRLTALILGRPFAPPAVAELLAGQTGMAALPTWEQVLQRLFYGCFVAHSVELGLLDLDHLHVAGDGAKLPTWANPYGQKLCKCNNRGKKRHERCRCHRAYSDPPRPLGLGQLPSLLGLWAHGL
ncbi:hypothetical protein KFU94_08610 [Chloroflexi bacterium TSY]|nr:hypothetical protein [Chloroflexi bacterium TSY]